MAILLQPTCMALLTRSVQESINDLVPFLILFLAFVFVFAFMGHLLYGPVLYSWSTLGLSLVTAIDIIIGNYMYTQLLEGVQEGDVLGSVIAVLYFYTYFFLMMLISLNIVIAILSKEPAIHTCIIFWLVCAHPLTSCANVAQWTDTPQSRSRPAPERRCNSSTTWAQFCH